MTDSRRAFYARPGSAWDDFVSLLHPPYTLWHLSYVAIGASLAPSLDWQILAGTILAFAIGLGIGAHALDELKGRPLGTALSSRTLWALGVGALAVSMAIAVIGAFIVSPWVAAWGLVGVVLAAGYALEWPLIHTDLGFGIAWGAFPVVVGYWGQTQTLTWELLAMATVATLLSLVQRALSTPARFVRRQTVEANTSFDQGAPWDRSRLLDTWERPLRLLVWTTFALAVAGLLGHI